MYCFPSKEALDPALLDHFHFTNLTTYAFNLFSGLRQSMIRTDADYVSVDQ